MAQDHDENSESVFDDYLRRKRAGEVVDFESLCAAHPDLAEDLRGHKRRWDLYGDLLQEPSAALAIEAGRVVAGKYELVRRLGGGGFGQVWLAKQLPSLQLVALKLAHSDEFDLQRATELRRRLSNEAVAMGRSKHPGIVGLLDSGVDDEMAWMAMEFVDGSDLKHGMQETRALHESGELPDDYDKGVAGLLAKVCDAMQAAHDAGVIHRDLKPDNIMVANAEPKVADFGLARLEDLSLSRTGMLAGTYYYMSPEQVRMIVVNDLDSRTDIFSLGVVLYELVALAKPFHGDTALQIQEQILDRDPTDPRYLRSKAAPELCVIAAKAMEKDRERRYQTMREFAADLRRFVDDEPILARPPTRTQLLRKWIRRHPVAASVIAVASVAGATISLLAVFLYHAERQSEARRARLAASYGAAELKLLEQDAEQLGAGVPEHVQELEAWIRRADALWAGELGGAGERASIGFDQQRARLEAMQAEADSVEAVDEARDELLSGNRQWRSLIELELGWLRRLAGREAFPSREEELARLRSGGLLDDETWNDQSKLFALADSLAPAGPPDLRTVQKGEEVAALALLERAEALASEHDDKAVILDCGCQRPWLLLQCGRLEEVPAAVQESLALLDDAAGGPLSWQSRYACESALIELARLRAVVASVDAHIQALEQDLVQLAVRDSILSRTAVYADRDRQERHDELRLHLSEMCKLRVGFAGGARGLGCSMDGVPGVAEKLARAREIEKRCSGSEGARAWQAAIAAVDASKAYERSRWPGNKGLQPQVGLWPLGVDPDSGLQEFAHLGSGSLPVRGADGRLAYEADSCVVLVLLPGGPVSADYEAPYGRMTTAGKDGGKQVVEQFELAPYFLAKHELTRQQLRHLGGSDPSQIPIEFEGPPASVPIGIAVRRPVDAIRWSDADHVARAAGCVLPAEIQWHYGAFGVAKTLFPWGDDPKVLQGRANTSDQTRKDADSENLGAESKHAPWEDGWIRTAAVGSFQANALGLHDMAGNLAEWCCDGMMQPLEKPYFDPDTGARSGALAELRLPAVKGGDWSSSTDQCRRCNPNYVPPLSGETTNGLRFARPVRP